MSSTIDERDLALHQEWIVERTEGKRQERRGETFEELELTGANLIGAQFTHCCFRRARFRKVEFNGSLFRGVDLRG